MLGMESSFFIWPPSLSELTSIIINTGLTHLVSEASILSNQYKATSTKIRLTQNIYTLITSFSFYIIKRKCIM